MQYDEVQSSSIQYSTVQFNTVQSNTMKCSIVEHCVVTLGPLDTTWLSHGVTGDMLHRQDTALYCTALNFTKRYYTHYTSPHYTVLHYTRLAHHVPVSRECRDLVAVTASQALY